MAVKGSRTIYACQNCGYQSRKWLGKCLDCGQWNSFVEERERVALKAGAGVAHSGLRLHENKPILFTSIEAQDDAREVTGIEEFDRVLGGGIVPGSLVLIGGEPGVGKSSLLSQVADKLSSLYGSVLYVSGEESERQIKLRGERLGISPARLYLLSETNLERIFDEINKLQPQAEFERQSSDDAIFRCEHILAVKHSISVGAANAETTAPAMAADDQPTLQVAEETKQEINDDKKEREEDLQDRQVENPQNQPEVESSQSATVAPLAFTSVLKTLRQPIDAKLIKTREGWTDRQGVAHWVEYIEWRTVADILDRVAPYWSHAVRHIAQIGDVVAVTASITIDGVTREGVGTGPAESETGIKKAEHDALKRAAVKFGVARNLYQRESEVIEEDGIAPAVLRDPRSKTLDDLVTPKQLWMIRSLGREIGCDVEQECQAMLQCGLEEMSKRAASSFIDCLKRQQQENRPEELRRAS